MTRILFGLSQLPLGVKPDDPRLPGVVLGAAPLRLNTEPHRGELAAPDHASRVAVARAALHRACGDYARAQCRFIDRYFTAIAAELEANRPELAQGLLPYARLYAPEDWFWSALRPLPRAWIPAGERMLAAEFAFWDGAGAIAIERDPARIAALDNAGITVLTPEGHEFPDAFRRFWMGQALPVSPFRLKFPG